MARGRIAHVCFLVKDLEASIEHWSRLLSVLDPVQLQEEVVRVGPWSAGGDRLLMANFPNEEGAEIQLLQPLEGPSARLLERRGEGVHHVCFAPPDVDGAAEALRGLGIRFTSDLPYTNPAVPWQRFTFIRPEDASGTLVELCCPYRLAHGQWLPPTD